MSKELEEALNLLADGRAGWVHRRDAALLLGDLGTRAFQALEKHRADPDPDVRRGVSEALAKLRVPSPAPEQPQGSYSLAALAAACEKPGKREATKTAEGYVIAVAVDETRRQRVQLTQATSRDGQGLIQVSTRCGPASEKTKSRALRYNTKLVHCAFALTLEAEQETLLLWRNLAGELATPDIVRATVKEIAYYGDWLEQKLSDEDQY